MKKKTLGGGVEVVKTGILYTKDIFYPIINGVPIMLSFQTPLTKNFAHKFSEELSRLANQTLPNLDPMRGEKSIQATFTEEWQGLGNDKITFAYNEEQGIKLHRDVWLRMDSDEAKSKKIVLDVGCGFGAEARYLQKIFSNAKIVAVDLNIALVTNGMELIKKRIFPVVASLFRLPFKDGMFDHVHCQGVLHHTYSTQDAFKAIEKKVDHDIGTIFIWVYAWEDSFGIGGLRGFLVHVYWFISHRIFRPILSRLHSSIRNPIIYIISLMYHPLVKNRGINKNRNWKLKNTIHGIRDMFTPMYAHRHRHNEVAVWFEELSYNIQGQSPNTYEKLFGHRLLGIGFLGRK